MTRASVLGRFVVAGAALAMAACGGGGGSGSASSGAGGGGSSGGSGGGSAAGPVIVFGADFSLPAIDVPAERSASSGQQRGQVLLGTGGAPVGDLLVELLDVADRAAPVVLATTRTAADGTFAINSAAAAASATDLLVRAHVGGGSVLRAFAVGWTEINPGTEVSVTEILRLHNAGAFAGRILSPDDLANAQRSLGLLWQGVYGDHSAATAVEAVRDFARHHAPWNQFLENLSLASPAAGAGDIAGFMPLGTSTWSTTVHEDGASRVLTFDGNCFASTGSPRRDCGVASTVDPDLSEQFVIRPTGVELLAQASLGDRLTLLLSVVGDLPLMEFPYAVGTRVLVDRPLVTVQADTGFVASIKVTRRSYPMQRVEALGGQVQAVQVVLDYEIAIRDTSDGTQVDLIARERRWFSPRGGRVRMEGAAASRVGDQIVRSEITLRADAVTGDFVPDAVQPFAGVADVVSIGIRHRHAVHSQALGRVYVATADAGGRILELDGDSLVELRATPVPAVPRRLAVSADGTRLYAGLDNGVVVQLDTSTLSQVRQFTLGADPYGEIYDRALILEIDPFDAERVLVLAASSQVFGGSGAVLLFRSGTLALRDAPRYFATDYGWGAYSPNALAWSSNTRNEFTTAFLGAPNSLYRFRAEALAYVELAALEGADDVGWRDVGGEIVTGKGMVLNAANLMATRSRKPYPLALRDCDRFDTGAVLCMLAGASPSVLLHFDHASGEFLGSYRPRITRVVNGCDDTGLREGSDGLDGATLTPMGGARGLVRAIPTDDGNYCALHVWRLRGAAP